VREAVDVARRMWRGDEVTFHGRVVRVDKAKLNFRSRPDTRVLIAARSPRMLALAGEVADIVHIATFYLSIPWQRRMLAAIDSGARSAARPVGSFEIDVSVACSISADREAARRAARRPAAKGILWAAGADPYALKRWVRPDDFSVPDALVAALAKWDFRAVRELPEDADRVMTDEILDDFAVAGTPEECAARILDLRRQLPEVTGIRIDAVPPLPDGKLPYRGYMEMMPSYAEMIRIVTADSRA
jgi:5,10-methylenetetrahydromethanopterin reductase